MDYQLKYKPVIVVVAFNRLNALKRLLSSLSESDCPEGTKLIISIDFSPKNKDVYEFASRYDWPRGEKEVIYYEENLGLQQHILKCGDLSLEYGSVIILEDDLYVSGKFYDFAIQALDYYAEDDNISGVSLYKYPAIERRIKPLPFIPLEEESDVHFIQFASSWGQAWTKEQWIGFKEWYLENPDLERFWGQVPWTVSDWPYTSWKKYFISYMVEMNKFFVFPNSSHSTNFDDPGSNRSYTTYVYQSPLQVSNKNRYNFKDFKDSFNVYDASFEILPEVLKQFNKHLQAYDFDVDLYGLKRENELEKEYCLTTKKTKNFVFQFARSLKPHESNIIMDVKGDEIKFAKKEDVIPIESTRDSYDDFVEKSIELKVSDYSYFFRKVGYIRENLDLVWYLIKRKLFQSK